jgi:hypothetical protein
MGKGPVHVVPAQGSAAYVQVLFSTDGASRAPGPRAITVLFAGRTGVGEDAASAARAVERGEEGTRVGGGSLAALSDARAAFLALDSARLAGDWEAFGRAWESLRRALGAQP